MEVPTLLRLAEHEALKTIRLSGKILDVGGDAQSSYRNLLGGDHSFITINLDAKTSPDIFHDLEKPLPLGDDMFDHAVLVNVLEHVFEYRQLLRESVRVVKTQGSVIIVVPFLFPVHPSPLDFHRFTEDALRRECEYVGMDVANILPLGSGVFAARYVLLDRLLPRPLRLVSFYTVRHMIIYADMFWSCLARIMRKKYRAKDYALGYVVEGRVK